MMFWHWNDNWVLCLFVEFERIGPFHTKHIATKFDNSQLHSQTDAKKRFFMSPSPIDRRNFTLYSTITKSTGDNDSIPTA